MTDKDFVAKVIRLVSRIPSGHVMTYGQIASIISTPRAARVVGFVLRHLPQGSKVPWQRVINAKGMISIENISVHKSEQARRLQEEGIEVKFKDGNYWVDLRKHLWQPR